MSYLSSVKKQTGHSNTINTTSDTEHCHMKIEYVKRKMLSRAQHWYTTTVSHVNKLYYYFYLM